ncbi:aldehyde-activating protein [Erythrobacter sp. QSSC1-22B]|uniref:GFA family protein n=1 Tax=Erythrobacter sp. QSSC1-22B TaxID=1860125 RepID=UPI000804EDAF|nr:GFA family protein [Erythrobacter sp. QSSC1-22B]OBX18580.1 aldehyde-activating protein [Erythrobacter sp. QSSC1-22B]
MAGAGDSIAGRCLCGGVTIALDNPKRQVELCHCDMCRRWGGAFYAALSGTDFTITGEGSITQFRSSEWAERAFCKVCGSNLWYRFLPTGNRSFLAGLFPDAVNFPIEREIFVDERAAWCEVSGGHPKLTGAQAIAEAEAAGFTFD